MVTHSPGKMPDPDVPEPDVPQPEPPDGGPPEQPKGQTKVA